MQARRWCWHRDSFGTYRAQGWEVYKNLPATGLPPHSPGCRGWVAVSPNGDWMVVRTCTVAKNFAEQEVG